MLYRNLLIDGGASVAAHKASGTLTPFVSRIMDLIAQVQPVCTFVCWDCPRETGWRRALSPAYKANRPPADSSYVMALAEIQPILTALDIVQARAPGCEADDLLYSLSRQLPGPTMMASGDKDMIAAVTDGVDLFKLGASKRFPDLLITIESLIDGMTPRQWGGYLALSGDPVDGVAGVLGIGPAKAKALIQACPGVVRLILDDRLYEARAMVVGEDATAYGILEKAIKNKTDLELSYKLTRFAMVDPEIIDAEPDQEKANEWLRNTGLGRYAK
jgi:5'-3' exonuclease